MSDMKTGTIRAIALVTLLLPLALSEDSSFIALWQVQKFYIIKIYAYFIQPVYKRPPFSHLMVATFFKENSMVSNIVINKRFL